MTVAFGICGLGARNKTFLEDMKRLGGLQLVALCDQRQDRLEAWAAELNVSRLFAAHEDLLASDVDFILLGTPPATHASLAIQALQAGKHVLSEVPAVSSVEEVSALRAAVQKTGRKYMLAENFCYRRDVQAFARFIQASKLGRTLYAPGTYCHDARQSTLRRIREEGARLWQVAYEMPRYITHALGPLLFTTGDKVERLSASAPGGQVTLGAGNNPVLICVRCQAKSGAVFECLYSFFAPRHDECYSFTGEKGTLESFPFAVDPSESKPLLLSDTPYRLTLTAPDAAPELREGIMMDLDPGDSFNTYRGGTYWGTDPCVLAVFAECVRDDKEPAINVERALDMTRPGIAALESIRRDGD